MTVDQRQAWIRAVLPAGVVLAGYIWLFGISAQEAAQSAQAKLAAVEAKAPTQKQITLARRQLAMTGERLAELRRQIAAIGQAPDAGAVTLTQESATHVVGQLTDLISRHGLTVIEEKPIERAGARVPAYTEPVTVQPTGSAAARSTDPAPVQSRRGDPRLWEVRFAGRYDDAARMLAALTGSDLPATPMSLTMQEAAAQTATRVWTLRVWL